MFSRTLSAIVIPAIGLALFTCGMARANLVTNASFSVYTGTAPKDFFGNVLPTDWSSGSYVFVDAPGTADASPGIPVYPSFPVINPSGGNFIEADGTPGLSLPLTQTISTLTVGQNYNVSFYQAAGQQLNDLGATTEQWQVSLGSDTQFSALMSIPQGGANPWMPQTLPFTATSTSEVLSFVAIGTGGNPPIVFLDSIDMEATVPEPSAFLLLAGVGTVIAIGRLSRRLRANRTNVAA
jgi:hypothetical protein